MKIRKRYLILLLVIISLVFGVYTSDKDYYQKDESTEITPPVKPPKEVFIRKDTTPYRGKWVDIDR